MDEAAELIARPHVIESDIPFFAWKDSWDEVSFAVRFKNALAFKR